jgi:hypothetical protein
MKQLQNMETNEKYEENTFAKLEQTHIAREAHKYRPSGRRGAGTPIRRRKRHNNTRGRNRRFA